MFFGKTTLLLNQQALVLTKLCAQQASILDLLDDAHFRLASLEAKQSPFEPRRDSSSSGQLSESNTSSSCGSDRNRSEESLNKIADQAAAIKGAT